MEKVIKTMSEKGLYCLKYEIFADATLLSWLSGPPIRHVRWDVEGSRRMKPGGYTALGLAGDLRKRPTRRTFDNLSYITVKPTELFHMLGINCTVH
jgi:hypothetical protein